MDIHFIDLIHPIGTPSQPYQNSVRTFGSSGPWFKVFLFWKFDEFHKIRTEFNREKNGDVPTTN